VNFVPNKEAIYGKRINRKLYQKAVPLFGKIIAQNEYQQKTLLENYKRQALVLPNVWGIVPQHSTDISCDVIWVANFRKLKRAEWVVDIAKKMPDINIIMVGDGGSDVEYLKSIVHSINSVHNIQYLGKRSFAETNTLIKNSKVLICTSEFEGFPNTFIQAWSFGHPVVSTVDPNNVIKTNNLGYVADNVNDMISALHNLIYSESDYKTKSNKIREFFMKSYSSSNKFAELIKYIDV
jgi:glycosyltransferase involved in cell wall biosynthesis